VPGASRNCSPRIVTFRRCGFSRECALRSCCGATCPVGGAERRVGGRARRPARRAPTKEARTAQSAAGRRQLRGVRRDRSTCEPMPATHNSRARCGARLVARPGTAQVCGDEGADRGAACATAVRSRSVRGWGALRAALREAGTAEAAVEAARYAVHGALAPCVISGGHGAGAAGRSAVRQIKTGLLLKPGSPIRALRFAKHLEHVFRHRHSDLAAFSACALWFLSVERFHFPVQAAECRE